MKDTMEYKGFKAQIMEACRLRGEQVFELPVGYALPVYHADEFLHPPEKWMKGQGVFVVPVEPEKGLWFNWRQNDENNTAVIPTVKGANPITGMQTSGFHLEKYENKCPKHGCAFVGDHFCTECDFKWPERNYVSQNPLWWDGFRAGDAVRQFFFSEEELRDVATHMIGKENTVPAFGFAFFTPKERREAPVSNLIRSMYLHEIPKSNISYTQPSYLSAGSQTLGNTKCSTKGFSKLSIKSKSSNSSGAKDENIFTLNSMVSDSFFNHMDPPDSSLKDCASTPALGPLQEPAIMEYPEDLVEKERCICVSTPRTRARKKVEVSVGAGAKIKQALNPDTYSLDSWKEEPDASMTVYFIFKEQFEELKAKGMRDLSGSEEGMLEGIPVG